MIRKRPVRLLAALTLAAAASLSVNSCAPSTSTQSKLAPGQYEWHPERSPKGPVLMVVSIDDQMTYVYRNGVQIARSTVSTGRPGKETPTGVFTVLQRKVEHESSIYKGAQMPYMQRLTWSGIAMHAGDLPGYPASGGCIRLPYAFSQKLYGIMHNGATVAITKKNAQPSQSSRPAGILLASKGASSERAIPNPSGEIVWNPGKSRSGPFSILISYADQTVYVWRNGVQIGQSPIAIRPGARPPEGVFMMLENKDSSGLPAWSALSLSGGSSRGNAVAAMRSDLRMPDEFARKIRPLVTPGTILVSTSKSSNKSTRSNRNFDIIR
ncbi:L,D-transpeptidase family protein [Verrucomicrobiaceae bacterium N1E253]|uniref:L,D-transpeptidase family protein n=1 Tax=Oceaniferula marina TaxID=2748318 RepID=A0A851GDA2_9BACT|nr:L,D-transpeptidase family protein [Oceaniferula marina]NWK55738.1 L,D-transpeptidase family protein [Oceaniferula marina]